MLEYFGNQVDSFLFIRSILRGQGSPAKSRRLKSARVQIPLTPPQYSSLRVQWARFFDLVLAEGETVDKMYADRETILAMARSGKFVPCSYLQRVFEFC